MAKNDKRGEESEREPIPGRGQSGDSPMGAAGSSSPRGSERQSGAAQGGSGMTRRESSGGSMRTNRDPFTMMRRLSDEMDRMFQELMIPFGGMLSQRRGSDTLEMAWAPQIDVFEQGGNLVVRADLPGLDKNDVRVEVSEGVLRIEGERREEHEENREGFYRQERSHGHFHRAIPLPEGADSDNVSARFQNGVLEVTVPTPERRERKRQIDIH